MKQISAVIITHNEERNITRCLDSLQGVADEVVVVDSGSTDATPHLCERDGVRFVVHPWQGYSEQKNYANSLATYPWILSLDADESLSDKLKESILHWKKDPTEQRACSFNRLTNCCGHWVKHCGWYPDRSLRLFPSATTRWEGVVHEQLQFSQPVEQTHLAGNLLHYSYYTIDELATRHVHYALLAAQKKHTAGLHTSTIAIPLRTAWAFVRTYLLKAGFLDGTTGYIIAKTTAYYTFLKYTKLHQLEKQNSQHK